MDNSTTDPLSDVLRNVQLKACIYFVRDMPAAWGLDLPAAANGPLHMVLNGHCLLRCNNEDIYLYKGDAVMLPHGTHHQMLNAPDTLPEPGIPALQRMMNQPETITEPATTMLCGHFEWDNAFDHPFFRELPDMIVVRRIFNQPDGQRVREIVNLITAESHDSRPGGSAIADRMGEVLFVSLLRCWLVEQLPKCGSLAALIDVKLARALHYIHQYPNHKMDLDKLATVAGMSRTAFATRFKEVLGTPPATYLAEWRMLTARRLLMKTKLPTAEIVDRIGYNSNAAFNRAFKRKFGVTPGSIRQDIEKNPLKSQALT